MKFGKLKIIIKMARPKKVANTSGGNSAKQEVKTESNAETNQGNAQAKEGEKPLEEKVAKPTAKELELQAEIEKLKAGKVIEVETEAPKEVKIRPTSQARSRYQTHTVYVAKKKGEDWGSEQTREMSEQAYNAISKDLSLKVRLPRDSRLVEPEPKGCKDC